MAGPAPRETRWRSIAALAFNAPTLDPIEPPRADAYWGLVRLVAFGAIIFDIALWFVVRSDGRLSADTVDAFVAINIPLLAVLGLLGQTQRARTTQSPALVALGVVLPLATVVVWIHVTGSLTSYFLVAGAMLVVIQRALLNHAMGVLSVAVLIALHAGVFVGEELGLLGRAPIFRSGPGPVYETAAMRWSVITSITSVYAMTWFGANVLINVLRRTERALASAERRLAAVAEGAREGRLTGQKVARYTLLEVVGRGGMAEVYRGVPSDAPGGTSVAVKVLHPFLVEDKAILQRAHREAALASRLPASITAAVREVHLTGPGERVVILDYLDGEDLAVILRRRTRIPFGEAVPLLASICTAVSAVHAANIVHRDLKPHNLFVLRDGTVRVLDFGVARASDDDVLTRAGAILGTPGYMAPEILREGPAAAGPEADIYALGVIAYQVLTGERPALVLTDSVSAGSEPLPPSRRVDGVPVDLDIVIALALARDPRKRYQTAAELGADLTRSLDGTLSTVARKRAADAGPMLDETLVAG